MKSDLQVNWFSRKFSNLFPIGEPKKALAAVIFNILWKLFILLSIVIKTFQTIFAKTNDKKLKGLSSTGRIQTKTLTTLPFSFLNLWAHIQNLKQSFGQELV